MADQIEFITKDYDPIVERRSVVDTPEASERQTPAHAFILQIASAADEIVPWGYSVPLRDAQLRDFWFSESWLAGAVYGVSVRNASFAWQIKGKDPTKRRPRNTINAVTNMLKNANKGRGWFNFMLKVCIDIYTQDNGAFIELIRKTNSISSPVINVSHLDAARCQRTGDPEYPVIYTDRLGREKVLRWWQVKTLEEFPSPIEEMFSAQYSAVTRCLLAAQVLRDISVYKHEKVSGAFTRAIHAISNITESDIKQALLMAEEQNRNRGLYRYTQPVIVTGLDPQNPLSHVQIDLATLPDSFDEDTTLKWYVAQLALAFGVDYQEFAPLMTGALGTSQQAEILHLKTRGKGPALIMAAIEHVFNEQGILPKNVEFEFLEQDLRSETEKANARFTRAKERSLRIDSGEIDVQASREIAVRDGDLDEWMIADLEKRDKEREKKFEQQQQSKNEPDEEENEPELSAESVRGGIESHNSQKGRLIDFRNIERYQKRLRRLEKYALDSE